MTRFHGNHMAEELIGVVKAEVEKDQATRINNVLTVIKNIILWMNVTLNMDIHHGTNKGWNSLILIKKIFVILI